MPDYSKGIIYKLCCKDPNITDIYVGSTTNFRRRKCSHKCKCYNSNDVNNLYVYQFIRENGSWNNWDMVEVEKYNADDKQDLERRERFWLEELKASLNKYIPTRTPKEYREDNKEKIAEKDKKYRENNEEKIKKYREDNKEKIKKYYENNKENLKKYREDNKEKIAEKDRKYREKNKEKIKKYREDNKEKIKKYREKNKEKLAEQKKKYRKDNKEKIKKYREDNKEKIAEQRKKYQQDNKEKIAEKLKEKYTCECGSVLRKADRKRHEKTSKHQNYISTKTPETL